MNPRKMRNQQIYYATMKTASKQLSCALSKELRKKYGKELLLKGMDWGRRRKLLLNKEWKII